MYIILLDLILLLSDILREKKASEQLDDFKIIILDDFQPSLRNKIPRMLSLHNSQHIQDIGNVL